MDIELYYPKSRVEWRKWLVENHDTKTSVWVIFYKINTDKASVSWSDAVDEALCFGWIDSKKQKIDEFSYRQFFSRRNPQSIWSKVNKNKVQRLIANGSMTAAGLKSIETAKQNGSWTHYDKVEELIIPNDLKMALAKEKIAMEYFEGLSKSSKKILLYWVISAKRSETRQNRIEEIFKSASKQQKPKPLR
ncbi:YdeI/OmpD-associated family protein [Robertkochia solimangrovi]|uniref:YdeI/OmpD-associated family protein n=1 Tax=Robertkochia solimangrovi TaxID=2213046 RepID=UPI00117DCE2B|nr:YdeI/OmpD-associated family protein [Robertkochia solimangrovi]TRZ43531.1 hypothetical protein DMZ48_08895 [Robertkochia solimangrovi]